MSHRALPAVLTVAALLAWAHPSLAAPTEAEKRAAREFSAGQRAFEAGDFVHAAEQFEAAYKDKPHHSPLWNAARSWHRAGEVVRAANLYARYLREAPADARDRDQATASLREVSAKVGRIEVITAAGVDQPRLDGHDVDAPAIYVTPGEHVAEGVASGRPLRKVVQVAAGQSVSVTIAVPVEPPPPSSTFTPPPEPERSRGVRVLPPAVAVVTGVLTLAGGGLTTWSGLDTVSKKEAFLGDQTQPRLDDAFDAQTRTNVLLGTTIGLAVVTGVIAIVFTDWGGQASPKVGGR